MADYVTGAQGHPRGRPPPEATAAARTSAAVCWRRGGAGPTTSRAKDLPCGHFLAEEAPVETRAALEKFLSK